MESPSLLPRLWNHDLHALDGRPASPVLSGKDDGLAAPRQRSGKVLEHAVATYIGNLLAVDDERRAWLRAPGDLHHVTMQLGASDFQQHLLALALCRERKLEGIARSAYALLSVRGQDIPEVVSLIEPGDFHRGAGQLAVFHNSRKHRGSTDAQLITDCFRYRFPFEMQRGALGVRYDQGLQIQGLRQIRRRQDIGLDDGSPARRHGHAFPSSDVDVLTAIAG